MSTNRRRIIFGVINPTDEYVLCSQHMTLVSRTIIFKIMEEISVELINKIDVWKSCFHINIWVPVGTASEPGFIFVSSVREKWTSHVATPSH